MTVTEYIFKNVFTILYYSKPLTPTSPGNRSLPFIKVVEIKS